MPTLSRAFSVPAIGLSFALAAQVASADVIEANCTGMLEFDIYRIDTEQPTQDIELVGTSEVTITDDYILLVGEFGEMKFDMNVGTLYENGSDTGVYCTYSRSES